MARRKTVTRLIEGHEVPFLSLAGLCGELRALLAESGECMAGAWDFWGDTLAQIENQS